MPFSQDDQLKYKALYLQTAREYVKALQDNIAKLNLGSESVDIIESLHRDSHSLKGQSEMMGYHSIGALSLLMENIFRTKKENKLDLTAEIVKQISQSVQEISVSLDQIDKVNKELDLYKTIEKLKSMVPSVDE